MKKILGTLAVLFSFIVGAFSLVSAQDDEAAQKLIEQLPEELQALYASTSSPVLASAYDDFAAVPTPWRWCHSESYQGNPWRVGVTNELMRLVEVYTQRVWFLSSKCRTQW